MIEGDGERIRTKQTDRQTHRKKKKDRKKERKRKRKEKQPRALIQSRNKYSRGNTVEEMLGRPTLITKNLNGPLLEHC